MPHSDARTWVDAPLDQVVAVATDTTRLADWFELARPATADLARDLGRPGTRLDVQWRVGRAAAGHLMTVRRVRDVVHLDAVHASGARGHVRIGCSAWDGGTMLEVSADLDGWPIRRGTLRRALRRSTHTLAHQVTAARPATVPAVSASSRGGRTGLHPETDVGPAVAS